MNALRFLNMFLISDQLTLTKVLVSKYSVHLFSPKRPTYQIWPSLLQSKLSMYSLVGSSSFVSLNKSNKFSKFSHLHQWMFLIISSNGSDQINAFRYTYIYFWSKAVKLRQNWMWETQLNLLPRYKIKIFMFVVHA